MMTIDTKLFSIFVPCSLIVLMQLGCVQPPPPDPSAEGGSETSDSGGGQEAADITGAPGEGDGDGDGGTGDGDGDSGDGDSGDGDSGDGDGDGDGDMTDQSLYPLVDGASWDYVVKTTSQQVLGMDNTSLHAMTWEDKPAWNLVDEPDGQGQWSESVLVREGDLVMRVHREEMDQNGPTGIFDYDPGFVRASEGWTEVGPPHEYLYDRTAYDGDGQNPKMEARGHTFEVLAIDEDVTVPAGTFHHCVKVERVRTVGTESGKLVRFWLAPGVGKVREERPDEMEIEELVSVSIPGGVELP